MFLLYLNVFQSFVVCVFYEVWVCVRLFLFDIKYRFGYMLFWLCRFRYFLDPPSVCVVLIGFLKMFVNGVVVMEICRDQFAIIAEVTGCSSEWQGSSCCAVFASDVASYFLRGASDGVADISPAVIESLLWAAESLVCVRILNGELKL